MFRYGVDHMTIPKLMDIYSGKLKAGLCDEAIAQIKKSRQHVVQIANAKKAVYGINTGFGPLCDVQISPKETSLLQSNLLISHAVGVGKPISKKLVKIMMILKVHALSQGYSGIRLKTIRRIIEFIDRDLTPVVPEQGSVGASGDLAPLAHLFLPIIGEGAFMQGDDIIPANKALRENGIEPLVLRAKEGLALINGTQFILAHTIVGLDKMNYLLKVADVAGAMSIEGYKGSASPFKEKLHNIRPYKGNIDVARHMRDLLDGSENLASHTDCGRVQDPYSMRCIPQVHGASRNAYFHLLKLAEIEMNSVTDNPIIIDGQEAVSGGNFHGQPLAMALDYCSIASAELGNISDRRIYLLLEGKYGMPRLLTEHGGLHSGYMIVQYTTAALVTENKSLCFPPSADSVPTSLGQEDHVSMGSISSRRFNQILKNLEVIIGIELMCAAQAIEFCRPKTMSQKLEKNHRIIRSKVSKLEEDHPLKKDIDEMVSLVRERKIIV